MAQSVAKFIYGGSKVMDFKDKETGENIHLTKVSLLSHNKKDNFVECSMFSTRENIDTKPYEVFKPVCALLEVPTEKDKSPKLLALGKTIDELLKD